MAREGIPYVALPLTAAVLAAAFGNLLLAVPFILLAAFMAFFFRNPRRRVPADQNIVLSPADGRVTRVESLASGDGSSAVLVSVFLSPFDVHINRAPIAGEITKVVYTKGKFLMATRHESSLVNEQNALTIRGDSITVVCKQVAGILARRIVCWKRAGDTVGLGERFGLIKFSSRTDVLLPSNVEVLVTRGDSVKGGLTIIGRIR